MFAVVQRQVEFVPLWFAWYPDGKESGDPGVGIGSTASPDDVREKGRPVGAALALKTGLRDHESKAVRDKQKNYADLNSA